MPLQCCKFKWKKENLGPFYLKRLPSLNSSCVFEFFCFVKFLLGWSECGGGWKVTIFGFYNLSMLHFLCTVVMLTWTCFSSSFLLNFNIISFFVWVQILGAFYLHLTGTNVDVYRYLEPLYNDYRKVRRKLPEGRKDPQHISGICHDYFLIDTFSFYLLLFPYAFIIFMNLLTYLCYAWLLIVSDFSLTDVVVYSCDIALPCIKKRYLFFIKTGISWWLFEFICVFDLFHRFPSVIFCLPFVSMTLFENMLDDFLYAIPSGPVFISSLERLNIFSPHINHNCLDVLPFYLTCKK